MLGFVRKAAENAGMRLLWTLCCALPLMGQFVFPGRISPHLTGPAPRPEPSHVRVAPPGGRGATGYWGAGYWGAGYWGGTSPTVLVPPTAPEPKPPVLNSSSLYQADRAQPVMREYGALPEPTAVSPAPASALTPLAVLAFRDGRVEPVRAYWAEGEQLAYVTAQDVVRKVAKAAVDVPRSTSLSRQQGVEFRLP